MADSKVKSTKAVAAPAVAAPAAGTPVVGAPDVFVAGHKNEKVGEVVSTKMQKTIVVQVSRRVPHPLYKRIITKHKKFYAHDEAGTAQVGDVVRIIECRPLSKLKRWVLGDVIRRSALVGAPQPNALDVKI